MKRPRTVLPLVLLLLLLLAGGAGVALVRGALGDGTDTFESGEIAEGGGAGDGSPAAPAGVRTRSRVDPGAGTQGGAGESSASVDGSDGPEGADEPESTAIPGAPGAEDAEPVLVRGRVVDAADDVPLADARILVVRRDHGWYGTRSTPDGSFEGRVPDDTGDGAPVELRIARPGYRSEVVPWSGGPVSVRLQPRVRPPRPGAVEGYATDAGGRPLTGRILLTTYDEMGDHHGLWALADASGTFRLEGLPPGWWRMRLVGGTAWTEVTVPDGGTARAHLVGGAEPWPGTMTQDEFEELHRRLRERVPPGTTDELPSDAERERLRRIMAVQDLESRWRGARPAREVVVRGLPAEGDAWLRAATTSGPHHSWRARVEGGEARFPALTPERWRLALEMPGDAPVEQTLDVEGGTEPLVVEWAPAER